MYKRFFFLPALVGPLFLWLAGVSSFTPAAKTNQWYDQRTSDDRQQAIIITAPLAASKDPHSLSRRSVFESFRSTAIVVATTSTSTFATAAVPAAAEDDNDNNNIKRLELEDYLYKIIRVREATQQERRLISTGKFKDKARQNVKLAVKFMIQNYQLSDSIVAASAYLLQANAMRAVTVGQAAVQNLQTILEYFDAADVQNIKIDNLAGKEQLVIKGLESAQQRIDDFLAFFQEETVASVRKKIQVENELNVKEFDPALGNIINMPPPS